MLQRLRNLFLSTKSLAAPDADLLTIFGAAPSGAASPAVALTVPAVQSCVRLISEAAACLDLKVLRTVDGVPVEAGEHPVAKLLADRPNDWTDTPALIRDLVAGALITDKGSLALANKVDGRVVEIVRYEAAHVTVDYSGDGRLEPSFRINNVPVCPADNLRVRGDRDGVPYPQWAEEGHLIATPGNVVDYRAVEMHIRDLCARFDVREIGFDPAYAQAIMAPLLEDGLPVVTIRQGWVTQSPALNTLERAIVGRNLRWCSPVLRWCLGNVAIHTDSAGNRTMHKGKSRDRIDLAVALWIAVSRCQAPVAGSIYDDPEWAPELMVL
ncbi:terminase large subunit [Ancylobacter sp. 6x-1]|uniref:Terminase large subunit n=1 Tax=Ancylobacter crimeensis TaxID=2579147 RepID=A0ABT0DG88_9HYPH|nr:terminase TerL endonuclease subunit [Ancylobacter crimeensis]MCK0198981.1 terminase large subunit [Ancylobacter crimeensis]